MDGARSRSSPGRTRTRSRAGASLLLPGGALLFLALGTTPAATQAVDPNLWGTDGTVTAIARSGNTVYIGGAFTQVGASSGYGVPLSKMTGEALRPYPKVAGGYVFAVAPDGEGGWYVGGDFAALGGLPRSNLAHILVDGSVAPWDPSPDGWVSAIAVCGTTVYVGGKFTRIGGQARNLIAAVDATTGVATDWNPEADRPSPNPYQYGPFVLTVALSGPTVYVGGYFSHMGGQNRNCIAALDATTGVAASWDPVPDGEVNVLAVSGNTVYVGGSYWSIGGQPRNHLAALDASTGLATAWNPGVDRPWEYGGFPRLVQALAVRRDTVYVGGAYFTIGGLGRQGLAAVDATTGAVLDWNPNPAGGGPYAYVDALALSGDTLYVGGYFQAIGGQNRLCLAALDAGTGAATTWDPRPNNEVYALAVSDEAVYAGGTFTSLGDWAFRNNVAALDATTGEVTPWNPNAAGYIVNAVAVDDSTVYVGGDFGSIGGQPRVGLAAIHAATGAATGWDPRVNGTVEALALDGNTLYVGGGFSSIGGQPRRCLAALDVTSGAVLPWVADANDKPTALAVGRGTVYACGFFGQIGGQSRNGLAALDAVTGATTAWNPAPDSYVNAVAVRDSTVYLGGWFSRIGGQPRSCIAAVDARTGLATDWNPGANDQVEALAVSGNTVYVGGFFRTIGGQARTAIAAVDATTAAVTDWNPGRDGIVWSLRTYGSTLYAGGMFSGMGDLPSSNLAAVSIPGPPVEPPLPFALVQSIPNPARASALIRFTLPEATAVTLSVYDVQGRRVARLLDHEPQQAGRHDVPVRADAWRPGVYLYRLEAGGRSATRKMLVVK